MKRILKLAVYGIAAIAALSSCSKNEDVPSQKDIETKIIGRWKETIKNGEDVLTNDRTIRTVYDNHKETHSCSHFIFGGYKWVNRVPHQYEITGNDLYEISENDAFTLLSKILSIDNTQFCANLYKCVFPDGTEHSVNNNSTFQKVTADYSEAIIGMWEGVEMTGDETYGDANHRIEYKADGTYTYYDKVGDSWVPSKNAGNEYNVDGDWLATRWQPTEGADYEYEWWDIDEIKDGTMKWSALREKGDKTRYTTTFTWKKVNLPTQEEIETKIIGKWKSVAFDGVTQLTNGRAVMTYFSDKTATFSMSRFMDELDVYAWSNKIPQIWSVEGNTVYEKCIENSAAQFKKVVVIEDNNFSYVVTRVIEPQSGESTPNWTIDAHKVTADYSQDIIGMWEGVEMTGDETYGDANHRIEYKADGTYVYYDKDGENWKPSENVDNEYNVDGDWLASRWRPKAGEDFEYEWWDIVEIKDGTMKWSALREKGDKTRYTTTFTWKKIQ